MTGNDHCFCCFIRLWCLIDISCYHGQLSFQQAITRSWGGLRTLG
jgi:hypothetical protein